MLDFVTVTATEKKDVIEIKPDFLVNLDTKDLMVKGGHFYAVWDEEEGRWSTSEKSVIRQIDKLLDEYVKKKGNMGKRAICSYMRYASSGSIDKWHKFVKDQIGHDIFVPLDEKIIFSNDPIKREDYASKRLSYPLEGGDISAYDELMSTLYDPEEREKLEWAIGAIISGRAKYIQKFIVLYGSAGTGKSTFLNIVERLFDGYCCTFNAKQLTSSNNNFAMASFKNHPLVGIQHDGDLSKIEDNTGLNSLVSHEIVELNDKYEKKYPTRIHAFLFMGTNKPVKITEAKSGLMRRLIDVRPSGKKLPVKRYNKLMNLIGFELGAIAKHCLDIFNELGENYYDNYVPLDMMSATNDFYDFMDYNYDRFKEQDMVTSSEAWNLYKEYCEYAGCYRMTLRAVRVELLNYFKEFQESAVINGVTVRRVYSGFLTSKFEKRTPVEAEEMAGSNGSWLVFKEQESLFDKLYAECPAQYSGEGGGPERKWSNCKTKLKDLDTSREHWVSGLPANLIEIDFDIPDESGNKSYERNYEAASKWTPTYAELSKSGQGIHLEYLWAGGNPSDLRRLFDDHIEIKVHSNGEYGSPLRRRLTKCNDIPISTISSGLPLKGEGEKKKVVDWEGFKNEQHLRNLIQKNLDKKIHGDTTSSIDYIKKLLDDAYEQGLTYDVGDLLPIIQAFALKSSNQKDRCIKTVASMKFKSEDKDEAQAIENDPGRLIFIDVEVYRNLFVIVWKYHHADTCTPLVNPQAYEVEYLLKTFNGRFVGFNSNNYDAHILWAAAMGKSTQELYELSQAIIGSRFRGWNEAKKFFYTDVFEFCTEKKSLKKWEISLDIHHQEMGIPWDQDVPDERVLDVVQYCENDVRATEAVFEARQGDFRARLFQVELVRLLHGEDIYVTPNDSTNNLSKRIIFGNNRDPQGEFNWRDLSKPVGSDQYEEYLVKFGKDYRFRVFNADGLPEYRDYVPGEVLPAGWSILPFFPGYSCVFDDKTSKYLSTYLGETIGEGGRVYSVKGYYSWVWDGDISSQHPHSIIAEVLFGPRYTKIFEDIVKARVAVKHGDFELAGTYLNGALKPFLSEELAPDVAQALKIVVNSIYGLTKAGFRNEFRDPRNFDNIVAKRGALFMTLLKREVERRGFMVCHIKTDSIKIPQASQEIMDFVVRFGREYGYEFETEGVFVKFALFNDAAYVAKTEDGKYITKADQFNKDKQPYLYKTLFSHEPIDFKDMCETHSVSKGAIYLDMNEGLGDPVDDLLDKEQKKLDRLIKKAGDGYLESLEVLEQLDVVAKLKEEAPKHHNYVFIGRVGLFTPVISGAGGGEMWRIENGKKYAVGGTSGYRWLEAEEIKKYGKFDQIDKTFFMNRVDDAVADFNDMVDFDWFVSDALPPREEIKMLDIPDADFMNIPEGAPEEYELPWDE